MSEEERRPKKNSVTQPVYDPRVHNHMLGTTTEISRNHQHAVVTTSGPAILRGNSHVHRIDVLTSYDPKEAEGAHWHNFDIISGPAVELPDDQHTHYYDGKTSVDLGHCHCVSGSMDSAPDIDDDDDDCEDDD